ncbi:DUF2911 domain-containing protein [Aquimarina agarilytica]|uniref:DUF2911 domain-containing protein n=1 Tax=Aquimarina agarilytica TaxID=1087449 RepID=UPI0002884283|nr:DUF2911 domain-containing protein [Aquimarina agarilytica]
MKKISLLLVTVLFSLNSIAQIKTPQPSPAAKVMQVVGLTDVSLEYSRPSMRGRTIFGDLVPFGKLWRTGANKNTIITFNKDITISGKSLKAGSYAIFATPSEKSWDINFYTDTENWGTPKEWSASKVAATITATTSKINDSVESFTISIDHVTSNTAHLVFSWENTKVAIPFEVTTDTAVMKQIDKVMNGPDAKDYYAAAVYYLSAGKDINKAKEWMDKAMSLTEKPQFWQLRKQSLIYAKAGDTKKAIEIAKKSLAASETAGNTDYVKMNKDSLKEWGAL